MDLVSAIGSPTDGVVSPFGCTPAARMPRSPAMDYYRYTVTLILTQGLDDDETARLPSLFRRNSDQPYIIQVPDVHARDFATACAMVQDGLAEHLVDLNASLVDLGREPVEIRRIEMRRIDLPPVNPGSETSSGPPVAALQPKASEPAREPRRGSKSATPRS